MAERDELQPMPGCCLAGAAPVDAMADAARSSFLLSKWIISTGGLAMVAEDLLDRVKRLQLVQPKPFENTS